MSEPVNWEATIADIKMKDPSKPRLSNKRLLLTYKTHINKEEMKEFITSLAVTRVKKNPVAIEIAHETGKTGGVDYPHTHVAVDFGDLFNNKSKNAMRTFDWETDEGSIIHPNIRVISTNVHWKAVMRYLSKEDPDNSHLIGFGQDKELNIDEVLESKTDIEAIKNAATKWSDVNGILATRRARSGIKRIGGRRGRTIVKRDEQAWWQLVFDIHEMESEPRLIHWIYDRKGGSGKTRLCRYMRQDYPNDWITLNVTARTCDAAEFFNSFADDGWEGHGIIIDVPRQCNEWKSLYTVIEDMKSGYVGSWKNSSKSLELDREPHVIVMSNRLPMIHTMSLDRWKIYELKNGTTRLMTLKEVKDQLIADSLEEVQAEANELGISWEDKQED